MAIKVDGIGGELAFTPYAWAKIQFFMNCGNTEIAGFGETPNNALLVEDFHLIKQRAGNMHSDIDDEALADYFEEMAALDCPPENCGRVWIHTHPEGVGCDPSQKDLTTFRKGFGRCDYAMMIVLCEDGTSSCRLRLNHPLLGEVDTKLRVVLNWTAAEFPEADHAAWQKEYDDSIEEWTYTQPTAATPGLAALPPGYAVPSAAQPRYEEPHLAHFHSYNCTRGWVASAESMIELAWTNNREDFNLLDFDDRDLVEYWAFHSNMKIPRRDTEEWKQLWYRFYDFFSDEKNHNSIESEGAYLGD